MNRPTRIKTRKKNKSKHKNNKNFCYESSNNTLLLLGLVSCGVTVFVQAVTAEIPNDGVGGRGGGGAQLHDEDGGKSHAQEIEEEGMIPEDMANIDGWNPIDLVDGNKYEWAWPGSEMIGERRRRVFIPGVYNSYARNGGYGGGSRWRSGNRWGKRFYGKQLVYPNKRSENSDGAHNSDLNENDRDDLFTLLWGSKRNGKTNGRPTGPRVLKGYRRASQG